MSTYRYQVNYSKRFTSGLLVNRLYHDHVRFATWQAADEFRQKAESGKVFEPCAGNSAYVCEDVSLFAIE